jgi:hypothetical protein
MAIKREVYCMTLSEILNELKNIESSMFDKKWNHDDIKRWYELKHEYENRYGEIKFSD